MRPPVTDFIATEARLGAHNYKPLDVVLTRGEGVWVWDIDGNRYLDCLSAYSAVNQGHCHPKILAAMVEQAGSLTLTSRAFRNDQLAPFYEELAALTGSHKVLPMNSGAEAVETAIKAVRKWGYEVKGVPEARPRSSSAPTISTAAPSASSASRTDPDARDGFRPVRAGLPDRALRRRRGARGGDHAQHRRLPGRADPGRGRRHHSAGRLFHARCASSAPRTTSR